MAKREFAGALIFSAALAAILFALVISGRSNDARISPLQDQDSTVQQAFDVEKPLNQSSSRDPQLPAPNPQSRSPVSTIASDPGRDSNQVTGQLIRLFEYANTTNAPADRLQEAANEARDLLAGHRDGTAAQPTIVLLDTDALDRLIVDAKDSLELRERFDVTIFPLRPCTVSEVVSVHETSRQNVLIHANCDEPDSLRVIVTKAKGVTIQYLDDEVDYRLLTLPKSGLAVAYELIPIQKPPPSAL